MERVFDLLESIEARREKAKAAQTQGQACLSLPTVVVKQEPVAPT